MADETPEDLPAGAVRTSQIIAFALLMGVVTYLGFAVFRNQTQAPANQTASMLSYSSVGFFVIMAVFWFILPSQIMSRQVAQIAAGTWKPPTRSGEWATDPIPASTFASDTAKLCAVYQTGNIIGWALLEGSAFFAITAYLLEGKTLPLYVVGAAILLMLQTFPTRAIVENWINRQKSVIEEIRSTKAPE